MAKESAALFELDTHDEHYQNASQSVASWIDDWDFKKAVTKTYTHRIHTYPAIFIPQLVRKLLLEYSKEGDVVLDIFSGSGTTLVECSLLGRHSIGIELNPLAVLIASVKTTIVDYRQLEVALSHIKTAYSDPDYNYQLKSFKNIDFWYTQETIKAVSKLLAAINSISDLPVRRFYMVTLSAILREVSLCKHSGFKMHKDVSKEAKQLSEEGLFLKFEKTAKDNLNAYQFYHQRFKATQQPRVQNIQGSSTDFQKSIGPDSVDLIVTSPPYGDSRTTVAYGQFSRLSSQWLDLGDDEDEESSITQLDNDLLGGRINHVNLDDPILNRSITLNSVVSFFRANIEKETDIPTKKKLINRLKDVLSFYIDLEKTIINGAIYLKPNKYFILVTASRIVKGIKLHTDNIIAELAEHHGLELKGIVFRNIINKRMPSKVSATNVIGEKSDTMTRESIIILKKAA